MNQLLILRRMYDSAPSIYPYARYTINKSTTSNLKIAKVININNYPCLSKSEDIKSINANYVPSSSKDAIDKKMGG